MSRGPSVCAQHIAAAAAPSTAASSSTETFGSLTRAQTVFFAGTVGVIVVNLSAAQPLIGPVSQSLHLPASLAGALLLLAADIAARLVHTNPELKLGVFTSILGTPFFFWLVVRIRKVAP